MKIGLACLSVGLIVAAGDPPVRTYRGPDNPVEKVLAKSGARIFSDDPRDYTVQASENGLRELDAAVSTHRKEPRLQWDRYYTLDRLNRPEEARAAREEAIRLARSFLGGDDLLRDYLREHAIACAKKGKLADASSAFLELMERYPTDENVIRTISLIDIVKGTNAPDAITRAAASLPDRKRREAF